MSGCAFFGGVIAVGAVTGAAVGRPMMRDSVTVVTFSRPADVATVPMRAAAGTGVPDTVWLRGLLSMRGRISARRGDSLELDLVEVRDGSETRNIRAGTMRTVVLTPRDNLSTEEVRRPRRAVGALLGTGAAILLLYGMIAAAAMRAG
jgi:hypothetical protein